MSTVFVDGLNISVRGPCFCICVIGRSRYWQMACSLWTQRSCLIERQGERENWPESWVGLPPFDREAYVLGHIFPPGALHHAPNRCPLQVCTPLLTKISVSLSPFLCFCLLDSILPSSLSSWTVTGGQWLPPPSLILSLSFPVLHQTDVVPRRSPWISCSGVWWCLAGWDNVNFSGVWSSLEGTNLSPGLWM